MNVKLYDSELKVMDVLWKKGEMSAKDIALQLEKDIAWNKNTTYTIIKKCIKKGAIERKEPNFVCKPLISRKEVQKNEINELSNRLFGGSRLSLLSSFVESDDLTQEEWKQIWTIINPKDMGISLVTRCTSFSHPL